MKNEHLLSRIHLSRIRHIWTMSGSNSLMHLSSSQKSLSCSKCDIFLT